MKITTKTGDKGLTSLFGGKRVGKNHKLIELVGLLDELQAFCAFAKVEIEDNKVVKIMEKVIDDLYRMMAIVGFEMKVPKNIKMISEEDIEFLEGYIEKAREKLKNLNRFIRPGTTESAARLNLARCVCRRVERAFVAYGKGQGSAVNTKVALSMIKYLNRLSDLFFVLTYGLERENLI